MRQRIDRRIVVGLWLLGLLGCLTGGSSIMGEQVTSPSLKTVSTFFPATLRQRLQANIAKYDWAKQVQQQIVQAAQPWRKMSDDEIWSLMFGPTITRSWMV